MSESSKTRFIPRPLKLAGAAIILVIALVAGLQVAGISPISGWSTSSDSRIVQSIETKQDIALLNVSVQGLKKVENGASFLKTRIPGSSQTFYLPYRYTANLGIDGEQVAIKKSGDKSYTISVPEFKVLGNSSPSFEKPVENGDLLSFLAENADQSKLTTEILSDESLSVHISENKELLRKQCETFYSNIIHAIDPEITLTFEYADA